MKRTLTMIGALALMASLLLYAPARKVKANTPVINVTSPTGTVFVSSFPYATSIALTIHHVSLKDLNVFEVTVDGNTLTGVIGNPFDNSNQCRPAAFVGGTTCNTSSDDDASVTVPWSVPGPGTYTVGVRIRHNGSEGTDEEDVTFALVAVEYPAPPAIANGYINSTYKKISATKRGCIISQVANNHAHESKYGPKGGPYDNDLVKADVDIYIYSCP
jgi:hypothetical protein